MPANDFIQNLRTATLLHDEERLTDGQLLGLYVDRRDESAFAAIVRRHGPMVWGVCCRLLDWADAEDAFQATFLVLVRKAPVVIPRERLGNWLYGVASQAALQARRLATRRKAREQQRAEMPDPAATEHDPWSELRNVLDEELSRLPDRYREVIVLCDLEGRTRKDVACQLGVPDGSVAGWLARARGLLAKRLTRRGIGLPAIALAVLLERKATVANVPSPVVNATTEAASAFAADGTSAPSAISRNVSTLTEGVIKTMFLMKLKTMVPALCLFATLGFCSVLFGFGHSAGEQGDDGKSAEPAPVPAEKPKGLKEAQAKDQDLLQGLWQAVELEANGQKAPAEAVKAFQVQIKGDQLAFSDNRKHTFALDPTSKPKAMDLTPADGPVQGQKLPCGIYNLDGDNLTLCIDKEGKAGKRPTEFKTAEGDGFALIALERVKDKKAAPPAPDWKLFDDPNAFLLTDEFAKTIRDLSNVEKSAAMRRLVGSLKSTQVEIRRRAALTLAALGDKSGVPTLMADLSTATGNDQNNVAVALRILKDERSVQVWQKALKDKSPNVRGIAAAALAELKVTKAYAEIVDLTKDKEGLKEEKVDGRLNCFPNCPAFSACYALGELGDERAIPVLIGLLDDADIQSHAIYGLEILTKQKLGKDPEKWKAWWKTRNDKGPPK